MTTKEVSKVVTLKDCADYARKLSNVTNEAIKTQLAKQGVNAQNYAGIHTGVMVHENGNAESELLNVLKQVNNVFLDVAFLYVENIVLTEKLRKLNPPEIAEIEIIEN